MGRFLFLMGKSLVVVLALAYVTCYMAVCLVVESIDYLLGSLNRRAEIFVSNFINKR